MRLTGTVLLLFAALALAPTAIAQETTIGFTDSSLDAMPPAANAWADLARGTLALSEDGTTLVATIELSALPEMQPGVAYLFLFHDGEREWFTGAVTAPTLEYYYGRWSNDEDGPDSVEETSGSYTTGPGGAIRIEMPRSALGNATAVALPRALSGDIKSDASPVDLPVPPIVYLDEAVGEGELALPAREPPAESSAASDEPAPEATAAATEDPAPAQAGEPAANPIPALGFFATLGAVLGAILAGRRTDDA